DLEQADEALALALAAGEVDVRRAFLRVAVLELSQLADHLAGAVDARLLLRRARLGPLAQPRDLAAHRVRQALGARLLVDEQRLALFQEIAVVARAGEVTALVALVELDDPVAHALEEAAVVRDGEESEPQVQKEV